MGRLWDRGFGLRHGEVGSLATECDADGGRKADGPPELIRALKTGGENDAHALRRAFMTAALSSLRQPAPEMKGRLLSCHVALPGADSPGCVVSFTAPDLKPE